MIKAVFLDLGGVLVELAAEREMRAFTGGLPREEMWARWLRSPAVRVHEVGDMSPEQFAREVLREYGSTASPEEFLQSFGRWIVGPYPGVSELIDQLSARYTTALLTNTCAYHWTHIETLGLPQRFHHVIASHLAHKIKPDRSFYEEALAKSGVAAHEAIFFDDNEINCEGARACGIEACRVLGADALRAALRERKLLD